MKNQLDKATEELPRSIELPRNLWQGPGGIGARIEAKRRNARAVRIGIVGASTLLAAACVLLSVRAAKPPVADRTPAITSEPAPVVAPPTDEVRPDEIAPEEATYLAAVSALEPTVAEREQGLPEKDAERIKTTLRALDTAIAVTRGSLADNPDDADLRAELDAEYEQKIDAMNDVLEWTTRS